MTKSTKSTKSCPLAILLVLCLFVSIRSGDVEITDVSAFLPGFMAVFSCPAETVFKGEEKDEVLYTLKVQLYVSNKDNAPEKVPGTDDATENIKVKIKGSAFDIKLNKSNFTTVFGDAFKTACDYTWKNLESASFKKEEIKAVDISSIEFAKKYDDGSPETVNDLVLQFGGDAMKDAFKVEHVNLLQADGGKGAATSDGYKVGMFIEVTPKTFDVTVKDQVYLEKLYGGKGDGYTPWYKLWWIWLCVGLGVLLIIGIIVFICSRGKGESYETK